MKEIIIRNFNKKIGKLLYVSGETISLNLHKQLTNEDYTVERIINYTVDHVDEIDQNFIEKLKITMPDIIYVYSQNSAKVS